MAVSFHVGILPNRPLHDIVDWIARADELGFGGVWVADSQSVFRDAFMALALIAKRTQRMELATGVTNIVTRHPAVLAQSFATLDELSGGRVSELSRCSLSVVVSVLLADQLVAITNSASPAGPIRFQTRKTCLASS